MVKRAQLIRMKNIYKSFGAVSALIDVDFKLNYNEIVGLVGDNGAGKTTLIKILSGVYLPNKGKIFFDGKEITLKSPMDAKKLGIETIHQNLALVEELNIERNIFMGREPISPVLGGFIGLLDGKRMEKEAQGILKNLKIPINSTKERVKNLSGGQRQSVAVGRSLHFRAKIIVMDEPTAALSVQETNKILSLTKSLREEGLSIIFISHNLYHVFAVADRITVLRHNRVVGERRTEETNMDEITELIVGEKVKESLPKV